MTEDAVTAYFHGAVYLASDGQRFVPEPWPTNVLDTCSVGAQVFIGSEPDPSTPADSFDVTVYSPSSFALLGVAGERAEDADPSEPATGNNFWFMSAWDQSAFERLVKMICAEASPGPDWESVAMRVGQALPWEYAYRYELRAVPRPDWQRDFWPNWPPTEL